MDCETVIVIGPGPAGSDLSGAEIDRHPVVRMWNHDWQPAQRYGSRYDYGLITTLQDVQLASRRPKKGWFFYNVPHEAAPFDRSIVVLDHMRWYAKAAALGARSGSRKALKFTRGFAAVAAAIEHLRPRRAIVIGMDVLRNGVTGARYFDPAALPFYVKSYPELVKLSASWAADQMPAGLLREGPHDYAAESALIRMLAKEAGTEIGWI